MRLSKTIPTLALVGLTIAELYDGGCNRPDAPVHLRVGTGGAGQSGLVKGS